MFEILLVFILKYANWFKNIYNNNQSKLVFILFYFFEPRKEVHYNIYHSKGFHMPEPVRKKQLKYHVVFFLIFFFILLRIEQ